MTNAARKSRIAPEVHAAMLSAQWAQKIGLPAGNMWEPAITRNVLKEWRALGATEQAWGLVVTLFSIRLGLS